MYEYLSILHNRDYIQNNSIIILIFVLIQFCNILLIFYMNTIL